MRVAANVEAISELPDHLTWVRGKVRAAWSDDVFRRYSGMGVRGTTRLVNLLPFGVNFFRP